MRRLIFILLVLTAFVVCRAGIASAAHLQEVRKSVEKVPSEKIAFPIELCSSFAEAIADTSLDPVAGEALAHTLAATAVAGIDCVNQSSEAIAGAEIEYLIVPDRGENPGDCVSIEYGGKFSLDASAEGDGFHGEASLGGWSVPRVQIFLIPAAGEGCEVFGFGPRTVREADAPVVQESEETFIARIGDTLIIQLKSTSWSEGDGFGEVAAEAEGLLTLKAQYLGQCSATSPCYTPVPTLNVWGWGLLALVLATAALVALRKRARI